MPRRLGMTNGKGKQVQITEAVDEDRNVNSVGKRVITGLVASFIWMIMQIQKEKCVVTDCKQTVKGLGRYTVTEHLPSMLQLLGSIIPSIGRKKEIEK